jgi:hypothetical protein
VNTLSILLVIHGVLAVLLIGALTHQAVGLLWPTRQGRGSGFVAGVRAVTVARYSNAVVLFYLLTSFIGGFLLYPAYRVSIRTVFEQLHRFQAVGFFELKENFVAVGLGLLPAYWYYWRTPLVPEQARARTIITLLLTFIVWWGFLVGHFLNNMRGFGL